MPNCETAKHIFAVSLRLSRNMRHLDEPRNDGVLLRDHLPERIDVVLKLSNVALHGADLGGGVVQFLYDRRLRLGVGAARCGQQQRGGGATPDEARKA